MKKPKRDKHGKFVARSKEEKRKISGRSTRPLSSVQSKPKKLPRKPPARESEHIRTPIQKRKAVQKTTKTPERGKVKHATKQAKPAPARRTTAKVLPKPKPPIKSKDKTTKQRTTKPAPVPRKKTLRSIPEPIRKKRGRRALLDYFPELDTFDELEEMLEHDEDEESEMWNSKESWFSVDSGERALKAAIEKKRARKKLTKKQKQMLEREQRRKLKRKAKKRKAR